MSRPKKLLSGILFVALFAIAHPTGAAEKEWKEAGFPGEFSRGEYCLRSRDFVAGGGSMWSCYQDNNRARYGFRQQYWRFCMNEMFLACQAKFGTLVVGGWEYFYGNGLGYGVLPNTYLVNVFRSTTYMAPYSTMDQTLRATSSVEGQFASLYGPETRICLEVYDWGLTQGTDRYVQKTLTGSDCLRPGDPNRTLEVNGFVNANHLVWVVTSLYHDKGDGGATFQVVSMGHDVV